MVLFILFPGFGDTKYDWNFDNDGQKTKFISRLSKIGKVYTYTPKMYNILYYAFDHPEINKIKERYDKDIKFKIDYLNIEKHCQMIYQQIKNNDDIIVIGHSIGAYFAYKFAELYSKRCICTIIINGTPITRNAVDEYMISKYDDTLEDLDQDKLSEYLDNISKKYNSKNNSLHYDILTVYKLYARYMLNQYKSISKNMKVQTYLLTSLKIDNDPDNVKINQYKIQNNFELEKINKTNVRSIYFINKKHHLDKEIIDSIIDVINKSI